MGCVPIKTCMWDRNPLSYLALYYFKIILHCSKSCKGVCSNTSKFLKIINTSIVVASKPFKSCTLFVTCPAIRTCLRRMPQREMSSTSDWQHWVCLPISHAVGDYKFYFIELMFIYRVNVCLFLVSIKIDSYCFNFQHFHIQLFTVQRSWIGYLICWNMMLIHCKGRTVKNFFIYFDDSWD